LLGACLGGLSAYFILGMAAGPTIPSDEW